MLTFDINTDFIMSIFTYRPILVLILSPIVLLSYSFLFKITRLILSNMLGWKDTKTERCIQNAITFLITLILAVFVLNITK